MDINEYIKLIDNLNLLIESLDTTNIEGDIDHTKSQINKLSRRINRYRNKLYNTSGLEYSKTIVEFYNTVKLSVRSATIKSEDTFSGRIEFDVIGWDKDNYLILQKKEWDSKVALKLYYRELKTRSDQRGFIRLFYNENDSAETGVANRQSSKEEVRFEFLTLK
jgi:hypothetical protein